MSAFIRGFLSLVDVDFLAMLIGFLFVMRGQIGTELTIVLAVIYFVRGFGHFWAVRQCRVTPLKVHFVPFAGVRVHTTPYFSRWDEGFSALGSPSWVLFFAVVAFNAYLFTGSVAPLLFSMVSFLVTTTTLFPMGTNLEGMIVTKAVIYSIREELGNLFMFLNIFVTPLMAYCLAPPSNTLGYLWIVLATISAIELYVWERDTSAYVEPMTWRQACRIYLSYLVLVLAFIFLPTLYNFGAQGEVLWIEASLGVYVMFFSLMLSSVARWSIVSFVRLKRRLLGAL